MTGGDSRVTFGRGTAVLIALALLLAGAGSTYLAIRSWTAVEERSSFGLLEAGGDGAAASAHVSRGSASQAGASDGPLPDVLVPISADAAERAGIVVTGVSSGPLDAVIRLPGVVEPNAYRQVEVTPLVAGRVTRVMADLGDSVRVGETMAQVYSPELAEAQTRYVSVRAELEAHERELRRTERLVEIGAASRQELERAHAEHAAQTARLQSARSTLELLGVRESALDGLAPGTSIDAVTNVPAPLSGVVTERQANVGLNVDQGSSLFTVVDLSQVWITAGLYERDFPRIGVGTAATITALAYPDLVLRGRVAYIEPQVSVQTRTAKVRVEVPNPDHQLRLGMYVDVLLDTREGTDAILIPRDAVQTVGDRQVVYLANQAGLPGFTEREVRLWQYSGDQVAVLSGLDPGDQIVVKGSFFVRAERERLGLRAGSDFSTTFRTEASDSDQPMQTVSVLVGAQGFEPATLALRPGRLTRLTFLRTTDQTCATEVVFPSLDIRRALPLNEPVDIEFTPVETGEFMFTCGTNMLRGTVVVQ